MKHFNLKLLIRDGLATSLEHGNFGECPTYHGKKVSKVNNQVDQYIAWPVNPDFTGVSGILAMLGIDRHPKFRAIGFDTGIVR